MVLIIIMRFFGFYLDGCLSIFCPLGNLIDIIAFSTFYKITSKVSVADLGLTILTFDNIIHRSASIIISTMIAFVLFLCSIYFLITHTKHTSHIPIYAHIYIGGIFFLWVFFSFNLLAFGCMSYTILNFIPFKTISSLPEL